ncbi:MAG: hypothetical protein ACD_45C00379G0001 [uncultured bacterium]|nr:MAG: hypothetical protein ACD_45C00379G0001 [uncultured bacterium]
MAVNANVDTLLQAATRYYRANCSAKNGPLGITQLVAPQGVSLTTLSQGGYLSATFPSFNPLVNSIGSGSGYIVQFNPYTMPRMINVCSDPPACTTTAPAQIGKIVLWKVQVSVALNSIDPDRLTAYQKYLSGDCLSKIAGSIVSQCSLGVTGPYVVFERTTSYAAANTLDAISTMWTVNPQIEQFNQMYTTFPMTYLTGTSHVPEYQYFYCNN